MAQLQTIVNQTVVDQNQSILKPGDNIETGVLQRMYNFEGITFSENALYGIEDSKTTELHGDRKANGPELIVPDFGEVHKT